MKIARFEMPDGRVARFEVPDDVTPEQATELITPQAAGMMASEGMGPLQAAMTSAGRTTSRMGSRLQQLYYGATGQSGKAEELAQEEAGRSAHFKPLEKQNPVATVLGGGLPYMAAPVYGLAGNVGLGVLGGLVDYADPGESDLIKGGAGAVGAGAGYGALRGLGKLITPVSEAVSPSIARAIQGAKDVAKSQGEKLGLTPGIVTGSSALKKVEASLESFPPTAGLIEAIRKGNQKILNRSAAKSIGEVGDSVDKDMLDNAARRIGGVFDSVAKPVPPSAGSVFNLSNDVSRIVTRNEGLTKTPLDKEPLVKKALDYATDPTSRPTLESLRALASDLSKRARSEITSPMGDRELGFALRDIEKSLNSTVMQNLSGKEQALFKKAMGEYAGLRRLVDNPGVVNVDTGDVAGKTLANVLGLKDKPGFKYGRDTSDIAKMAHFANATRDIVGDSGTASRQFLPWLVTSGLIGGAAGGGTALATQDQPMIGTGVAAGAAVPLLGMLAARGAGAAYLSPMVRGYLSNQVLPLAAQRGLAHQAGALSINPMLQMIDPTLQTLGAQQ